MNQRELVNSPVDMSLSNIPRKEVSAAPKRNKPGQETKYPKQLMQEAVPKKEVPRACTSENGKGNNKKSAMHTHPMVCRSHGVAPWSRTRYRASYVETYVAT